MRTSAALLLGCLVASSIARVACGQTSYAMLMDAVPLAVQQGQSSEVEIHSRYTMYGAYTVLVSGSGVKGEIVTKMEPVTQLAATPAVTQVATKEPVKQTATSAKPASPASNQATSAGKKPAAPAAPAKPKDLVAIKIRFQVEPNAPTGVRDIRLATPHGVTTLGQLVVVRDPVVREATPNDSLETATPVKLPATICGAVEKNEDVDFYKFHVNAGTALTFHVRSARCEDRIHDLQTHIDPIITLRNASGTVLAMSDNYFFADPLLHYKFPTEGDYYLEMRDVRYQGNQFWQYAIEANDRPFVTNVLPLGVAPGKPVELELIGYGLPAKPKMSVTPSADIPEGRQWLDLPPALGANPAPVVVSKLPLIMDAGTNLEAAKAQKIAVPAGINGRIAKPGERHYYQFAAKKGEHFTFEVIARRHQSAMDAVLAIQNDKGARLIENDDLAVGRYGNGDARIEN